MSKGNLYKCTVIVSIMITCFYLYPMTFKIPTSENLELKKTIEEKKIAKEINNELKHLGDFKCNPINENVKQDYFQIDNVLYPRHVAMFLNKSINFTCLNDNPVVKVILFWNKRYQKANFNFGVGKQALLNAHCPVVNCETTYDRNRINQSSLILFSMWDEIDTLPRWRTIEQRWVFVLIENQLGKLHNNRNLSRFNGLFNISATHSLNSNFTSDYVQHISWRENKNFDENKNVLGNKTEMAFQVSSNCQPASRRHIYIAELSKYINVDIYGKCGKPCPLENDKWASHTCKLTLIPKYKFYLSFENGICEGYITEKFYNLLIYDIIPVVYGGGPYDVHVPKSGYINAFDFETPKHLAEYMHKVANNVTLYNSYFQWKRYVNFIQYPKFHSICEMCIMLNLEYYFGVKHSVIENVNTFWNRSKECKMLNTTSYSLMSV